MLSYNRKQRIKIKHREESHDTLQDVYKRQGEMLVKEGREAGLIEGETKGRKEGRKEGREEGMNEKEAEVIRNLLGVLDDEVLMEKLHISKERLEEVRAQKCEKI